MMSTNVCIVSSLMKFRKSYCITLIKVTEHSWNQTACLGTYLRLQKHDHSVVFVFLICGSLASLPGASFQSQFMTWHTRTPHKTNEQKLCLKPSKIFSSWTKPSSNTKRLSEHLVKRQECGTLQKAGAGDHLLHATNNEGLQLESENSTDFNNIRMNTATVFAEPAVEEQ